MPPLIFVAIHNVHPLFMISKRSYLSYIWSQATPSSSPSRESGLTPRAIARPWDLTLKIRGLEPAKMRRPATIHAMVGWRPCEAYFHQTIAADLLTWSYNILIAGMVILEINAGKYTRRLHPNISKHCQTPTYAYLENGWKWTRRQCVHLKVPPTWEVLAFAGPVICAWFSLSCVARTSSHRL